MKKNIQKKLAKAGTKCSQFLGMQLHEHTLRASLVPNFFLESKDYGYLFDSYFSIGWRWFKKYLLLKFSFEYNFFFFLFLFFFTTLSNSSSSSSSYSFYSCSSYYSSSSPSVTVQDKKNEFKQSSFLQFRCI